MKATIHGNGFSFRSVLLALCSLAILASHGISWGATPQIAAGGAHTVSIRSDGTLWAAGSNQFGKLGDGSGVNRVTPVQIGASTWKAVAAGNDHTLGIKADGTLWAWGSNQSGQLGLPLVNGQLATSKSVPVQVGSGRTWVAVAAGSVSSLALKGDGTLWAWGGNDTGILGDGSTTARPEPVQVLSSGNGRYVSVSVGGEHALALQADGSLWSWGGNEVGQLGIGTVDILPHPVPVQIGGLRDWVRIAAGEGHSVALKADGSLWTWGENNVGQLGNGAALPGATVSAPARIGSATDWAAIASGPLHTLALRRNGAVFAWGVNSQGALGNGTIASSSTPLQITAPVSFTGLVSIAAGNGTSHAIAANGTIFSWGNNGFGQLGNGTTTAASVPLPSSSVSLGWLDIEPGDTSMTGRRANGTLWSWGANGSGQLGDGTTSPRNVPGLVSGGAFNWRDSATGANHTVALRADGTLWSWGANSAGQLGIGSTVDALSPQQITATSPASASDNWAALAAGSSHSLALKADGTIWAWGDNSLGQLGDGTGTGSRTLPVQITTANPGTFDRNWVAVAAAGSFSLARQSDGTIWAWGDNSLQQLAADPTALAPATQSNTPAQILHPAPPSAGFNSSWTAIAAGFAHGIAQQGDGTVWAWGDNSSGQAGNGTIVSSFAPVAVQNLQGIPAAALAAGSAHSLQIRTDGTLWSWGANSAGQRGNNTTNPSSTPEQVTVSAPTAAADSWTRVAAAGNHSAAIMANGTLWTWGQNDAGQLGNGTQLAALIPTLLQEPRLAVSPAEIAFGPAAIGILPSPTRTFFVSNAGTAPLTATFASNNPAFTLDPAGCSSLPPGGSCTVTVTFVPAAPVGLRTATVTVTSNDPLAPQATLALSATAANPYFISASVAPASPVGSGTITPAGSNAVPAGGTASFAISANPGYIILDVVVNGVSKGAISSYSFINVQQDHAIVALFGTGVTISASAGAGGVISPAGSVAIVRGGDRRFTITPDPGYGISQVNVVEMVEQLDVNGNGTGIYDAVPRNLGPVSSFTFHGVAVNGSSISATFAPRTLHTWNWRNPLPQGETIRRMTGNGNGTYVAVGVLGTILTSTDSATWTVRSYGAARLNGIAYGGGSSFVAVGNNGRILHSTDDGATWSSRSSGTDVHLTGITHTGSLYVAVGLTEFNQNYPFETRAVILTSPDGDVWTPRYQETPFNVTQDLLDIAWGGGRLVAVGAEGNVITSGDNGATWTALPPDYANRPGNFNAITYGDGRFVAVGDFGQVATSPDGTTWTNQPIFSLADLNGVAYGTLPDPIFAGNNVPLFLAVGTDGEILTSENNGVTWTIQTSGLAVNGVGPALHSAAIGLDRSITPAANRLIVAGAEGNILVSSNMSAWSNRLTSASTKTLRDSAFGNGVFVAVGDGDGGTALHPPTASPSILTSTDRGVTWNRQSIAAAHDLRGIVYGDGTFVAVGASGYHLDQNAARRATILTSRDGVIWTGRNSGSYLNLNDVIYDGELFVAVGDYDSSGDPQTEGAVILTSADGITWVSDKVVTSTAGNLRRLAAGSDGSNPVLLAVVDFGTILQSFNNGRDWVEITDGVINYADLNAVAFNDSSNTFATAGITDELFLSASNGASWNRVKLPIDTTQTVKVEGLAYAYGSYVAVGNDKYLLTSADGLVWDVVVGAGSIGNSLYSIVAGDGTYMATGSNGAILQSNHILGVTPLLTVSPARLDFADTPTGTASVSQTVTFRNQGDGNLEIGTVTLAGLDAGQFGISDDFCSSATVPANGTCTVSISFVPTSVGGKVARLDIPSNDPDDEQVSITLRGTAIPRFVITATAGANGTISPAGQVVFTTPGASQTFTITADPGYGVLDVLVNGLSVGALTSYTFTNISADQSISVTFTPVPPVRLILTTGNNTYDTLTQAFAAIPNNTAARIEVQAVQAAGSGLTVTRGVNLTLNGGFGSGFTAPSGGFTTITGVVTVTTGSLTISTIVIR